MANLIEADLLIILTDIDGLYSDDPSVNKDAVLVPVVETLTPQIEKLAKKSRTELSTGGMVTKIQAAKRCVSSGIAMNQIAATAAEQIIIPGSAKKLVIALFADKAVVAGGTHDGVIAPAATDRVIARSPYQQIRLAAAENPVTAQARIDCGASL